MSAAVRSAEYQSVLSQSLFLHEVTRVEIISLTHKDNINAKCFSLTSDKAANMNKDAEVVLDSGDMVITV